MNTQNKRTHRVILVMLFFIISVIAKAQTQSDPAHWAYGIKKLNGGTYELHLKCTIDEGWHIYAQKQGKDFIGTKTKIQFNKQPGLTLSGIPTELGKKETYENKVVQITNYQYGGTVDFVQKATIKPGIKEVTGTITYQTCTSEMCLPEKTITFRVPVN